MIGNNVRFEAGDFSHGILYNHLQLLTRVNYFEESQLFRYLLALDQHIWIALAVTMICLSFTMALVFHNRSLLRFRQSHIPMWYHVWTGSAAILGYILAQGRAISFDTCDC
jgi:hypothetical protein